MIGFTHRFPLTPHPNPRLPRLAKRISRLALDLFLTVSQLSLASYIQLPTGPTLTKLLLLHLHPSVHRNPLPASLEHRWQPPIAFPPASNFMIGLTLQHRSVSDGFPCKNVRHNVLIGRSQNANCSLLKWDSLHLRLTYPGCLFYFLISCLWRYSECLEFNHLNYSLFRKKQSGLLHQNQNNPKAN